MSIMRRLGYILFCFTMVCSSLHAADECIEGNCVGGIGVKLFADGGKYEGEFRAGREKRNRKIYLP